MMRCAKFQTLIYGLRWLWPSRNQGRSVRIPRVVCAKEISGCISNKGFCSCCSATFRRAELWQKCTLRTLRSPEELNVVILGKKLYQGGCWIATHVQTLQKQYSWCQSFALTAQIEKCHSACIVRALFGSRKVCRCTLKTACAFSAWFGSGLVNSRRFGTTVCCFAMCNG